MTLTWRDVAGQVRAPELADATEAISRGIAGLGQSVQSLAQLPEERRQADLAKQMMLVGMQKGFARENASQMDALGDDIKLTKEKDAQKAFLAAQSTLEAGARTAAMAGKSWDDFAKSEAYQALPEDAKVYGAAHLSDAWFQGDQARQQRQERDRNFALQQQQERRMAESARLASREANLRITALEKAQKEASGLAIKDAETRALLSDKGSFTARVGNNWIEASGRAYADKSVADLAKAAGIDNYSEFTESFNALNAKRKAEGKAALPEGVMKSLLAGQAGKNGWPFSWGNEVDQSALETGLNIRADMYDNALAEAGVLTHLRNRAAEGAVYTDAMIQAEFDKLKPAAPAVQPRTPAPMPTIGDVYRMAGK